MARTNTDRAVAAGKIRPLHRVLSSAVESNRVDELTKGRETRLGEIVCNLIGASLGIIIAPTRDGGAISFTVLDGPDRDKGYAGDGAQLDTIIEALDDVANSRRLTGGNTQ